MARIDRRTALGAAAAVAVILGVALVGASLLTTRLNEINEKYHEGDLPAPGGKTVGISLPPDGDSEDPLVPDP